MLSSCFGSCFGGDDGDDLLWHMDLKPHATGEYSVAVVQANSLLEDQGQVFTTPSATYVGVYDGHGGPQASRFINNNLFPQLQSMYYFLILFYYYERLGSLCFLSVGSNSKTMLVQIF